MKEVKRYTLTDYGYDGLCCDNSEKDDAFDSLRKGNSVVVVTASDFDAVLQELAALKNAIRTANADLISGEGISLLYYMDPKSPEGVLIAHACA